MAKRISELEQEVRRITARRSSRWLLVLIPAVFAIVLLTAGSISKPNTFSTGDPISSSQVNANFDTLYGVVNGNIDSANLADDAGSLAKVSGGIVSASGGNIGIGTATPSSKLEVAGSVTMSGFSLPSGSASGRVLTSDAGGTGTWQSVPADTKGFNDAAQSTLSESDWFTTSYVDVASVTVNVAAGQKVLLMYSLDASTSPGGAVELQLPVGYNRTVLCTVNGEAYPISYQYLDTSSSGSRTYTLQARTAGAGYSGKVRRVYLTAIVG